MVAFNDLPIYMKQKLSFQNHLDNLSNKFVLFLWFTYDMMDIKRIKQRFLSNLSRKMFV